MKENSFYKYALLFSGIFIFLAILLSLFHIPENLFINIVLIVLTIAFAVVPIESWLTFVKYLLFGIKTEAIIKSFKESNIYSRQYSVLYNSSKVNVFIEYEYIVDGLVYTGIMAKTHKQGDFKINDKLNIRYLPNKCEKSIAIKVSEFFTYELPFALFFVVLFQETLKIFY